MTEIPPQTTTAVSPTALSTGARIIDSTVGRPSECRKVEDFESFAFSLSEEAVLAELDALAEPTLTVTSALSPSIEPWTRLGSAMFGEKRVTCTTIWSRNRQLRASAIACRMSFSYQLRCARSRTIQ